MASVDLGAFLASNLRASAGALGAACAKMPDDRIGWHPPVEGNSGRDALDQAVECAYLNEWAAAAFTNASVPAFDGDDYSAKKDANRNGAAAVAWLTSGTEALAAAVEAFPAGSFGDTLTNPFTKGTQTWADFALFFYWNNVYHEGQVNYIQVLYGDMS